MGRVADEPWPTELGHIRLAGRIELVDGPFDETAQAASYDAVDVDDEECTVVLWRSRPVARALAEQGDRLAGLRDPHLLPIMMAGYDEALDMGFVVEAVSEQRLGDAIMAYGQMPESPLARAALHAVRALVAVHDAGLAHGRLSLSCLHIVEGRDGKCIQLGGLAPLPTEDLARAQQEDVAQLLALLRGLASPAAVPPLLQQRWGTASSLAEALGALPQAEGALTLPWAGGGVDALAATVLTGSGKTRLEGDLTAKASSTSGLSGPGRYAPLSSASLVGLEIGGRFRLERLLGEGGMGAVYQATGPAAEGGTPGRVAIKIIRPGAATEEAVKRFLLEARLSRELSSDHTVRVYEAGHDTVLDAPFMVMELLVGQDLRELTEEVIALQPQAAARIVYEAALGLAEAHDRGLVHRDIKPSNIFLHEQVDPADPNAGARFLTKVCDFGVAKLIDPEGGATKLTHTGGLLGSPAYMSPEQARDSKRADARADVWSLGATLYELLSGKHPWHGAGDVTELLVWLQIRDPAPLPQLAPWVDADLCAVVHRALNRVADERFSGAGELAAALRDFAGPPLERSHLEPVAAELLAKAKPATPTMATTHVERPPPAGDAPRRRWPRVLAGVAALVGAGAIWGASRPSSPSAASLPPAPSASSPRCASSTACSAELGKPATCQPALGCVALENEYCRVEGGPSHPSLTNDDTLWVGTMFPGKSASPHLAFYGTEARKAINLARDDFMSQAGGLLASKGRPSRPIGLLHCDDTKEPVRVAEHLMEVGISAVIGFSSSKEVVTLASRHFIPNDTLVVPAINMGAQIDKIPHPADSPRLVWRTVASQTATTAVADTLIGEFIEPNLRAKRGPKPLRVAVVRDDTAVGVALGEELFAQLRFNGGNITANGANFRQVVVSEDATVDAVANAAAELARFEPDVVLLAASKKDEVVYALEASGPSGRQYIFLGDLLPNSFPTVAAKAPAALSRIYGALAASTPTNDRYAMHFNAAYKTNVTPDNTMATPYDALYLVAYAAYAQPKEESGGSALARGIGRLVPPGEPIEVGPRDILTAFSLLNDGKNIDLTGTYGPMDFDARTGGANPQWNIVCPVRSKEDPSVVVATATGLKLDGDASVLSGELRCPDAP